MVKHTDNTNVRSELASQADRHEYARLKLLVAKLVDAVDSLEGEAISFTVGKNLALANDAVRVALGNESRIKS